MKTKSAIIAAVFLALCAGTAQAQQLRTVTLSWDYPAIPNDTSRARLAFKVHGTTDLNLPQDQWPVVAIVPGTNISATVESHTSVQFPVQPDSWYFYATAYDTFWDLESVPSNSVNTPAPFVAMNPFGLTISRP